MNTHTLRQYLHIAFASFFIVLLAACPSIPNSGNTDGDISGDTGPTVPFTEDFSTALDLSGTNTDWTGSWACSVYADNQLADSIDNASLRQVVRVSIPGNTIRLTLSNRYGESNLVLKKVHMAKSLGGHSIDTKTDVSITFGGAEAVTIPAGKTVTSDAIDYNLPALTNMAISIWYGSLPVTRSGHVGSRTNSYWQSGDAVSNANLSSPSSTAKWYTIAALDVVTGESARSIVAFGDSITDGRGTTTDAQNRWTDGLATRLGSESDTDDVGVLNQGIGGTLVSSTGTGRFDVDVLKQTDVAYLVMLYGVNDILYANASSTAVIATYRSLILKARLHGILVYGGTILPFGNFTSKYTPARETVRQEVNSWIRTTSAVEGGFDAVIDFDAALRDPANETILLATYDDDGLHPNPAGYQAMANAIDTTLFTLEGAPALIEPSIEDSSLFITDTLSFAFRLPVTLAAGEAVQVHMTGTNNGSTGFRVYLVDGGSTQMSSITSYSYTNLSSGAFELNFSLEATGAAQKLYFKGPTYSTNIDSLEVASLSVTINAETKTYIPAVDVLY